MKSKVKMSMNDLFHSDQRMEEKAALNFISKIPDQCGYLVIADGAVIKSDGELANRENIAIIAEKMANIARTSSVPGGQYQQLTVNYGSYLLVIVRGLKHLYVVKRKPFQP